MQFNDMPTIEADVLAALSEDLGGELNVHNDITANLIDANTQATARIITREPGILCGKQWANSAFLLTDPQLSLTWHKDDGDSLEANDVLVSIIGFARSILTAERTALNFLQFLSGTASTTYVYAEILKNSKTNLLDTRKTLPRYRHAQKYAVICGGGVNHRIGLYDAFLIKENHIKACGSIKKAVEKARTTVPNKPIEVEVETLEELNQAILAGADTIMLDNFSNEQIRQAVATTNGRCKLEVSGNIVEERLHELAQTGVDYISSGALTKHVKALDLSLLIE
jgi:nicotinate-nucleotide pyrophosphorylase (carboxylating)